MRTLNSGKNFLVTISLMVTMTLLGFVTRKLFVNEIGVEYLGLNGLLEREADMVVSGINHGANMGDDTIYSGTVAAATEAHRIARNRYEGRLSSYIEVLSAEDALLNSLCSLTDLQSRTFTLDVALKHALGGGYHEATVAAN